MSIFPFYNNGNIQYTIDDANYGCERIPVANCDGWHRYASICELIQDCPSIRQLTRPCIIEALNDLTTLQNFRNTPADKRFLRVTANGCLEIANPCPCGDWDRYVAATDWDTNPGPLNKKVKWSCSYDWLYCIDIEEAWPETLVRRPSGPNGPFINPKMPDLNGCESDCLNVKMCNVNGNWEVDYECPTETKEPQMARCTWTGGKSAVHSKWRTVSYFAPHQNSRHKPQDNGSLDTSQSYLDWDWVIKWTSAFWPPPTFWVISINEPGIYSINWSSYVTGSQTWNAFRGGVYVSYWDGHMLELGDVKYEDWEHPNGDHIPWEKPTFNRMHPDKFDPKKRSHNYRFGAWTIENTGLPFGRSYIINVDKPGLEIFLRYKPDMRYVDPRLVQENDSDDRYNIILEGANGNAYGAGTNITIAKIDEAIPAYKFKSITV